MSVPPRQVPPPATSELPPRREVDTAVTVLLLVGLGLFTGIVSLFGLMVGMVSDGCTGTTECDGDRIGAGMAIAVLGPWVISLIALVVSIVLMARRRLAFWVPLVAGVLIVGSWFAGAMVASSGVP